MSRPRPTARSSDFWIAACTAATFSSERATKTVSKPDFANTSMMPVAIVPEPTTPTRFTVRPVSSASRAAGVRVSATTLDDPGAAYV